MPPPDSTSEHKADLPNTAGGASVPDKNFYTWSVLFKAILRTATPQEEYQYFQQRSIANEEKDCERCESWKEWNLQNSPVVRFLREQTALVGGPDMASSDFLCRRCPYLMAGGYSQSGERISSPSSTSSSTSSTSPSLSDTPTDPDNPSPSSTTTRRPTILLCANHLKDRSHQEDTMAHELVHAYDYARFRVSPRSLHHQACTEIRASTLSGECRVWKQFGRRNGFRVANSLQECVRRRAALSLRGRPGVDDLKAAKVVNEVFESCFRDTRPFDEIYR